jgi:hypothetical protein
MPPCHSIAIVSGIASYGEARRRSGLPDTDAELVVHLYIGPETDVLVEDVDAAFALLLNAGGEAVQRPFDIATGRCARVRDPFGNELVILDQSKGRLVAGDDGRVIGVEPLPARRDGLARPRPIDFHPTLRDRKNPPCARTNVLQMF